MENRSQIYIHELVDILRGGVENASAPGLAGIVDENVERGRVCEARQRVRIVQVDHTGAATRLRRQDCQPFRVTPGRINL
jgi:hypothetical protein